MHNMMQYVLINSLTHLASDAAICGIHEELKGNSVLNQTNSDVLSQVLYLELQDNKLRINK